MVYIDVRGTWESLLPVPTPGLCTCPPSSHFCNLGPSPFHWWGWGERCPRFPASCESSLALAPSRGGRGSPSIHGIWTSVLSPVSGTGCPHGGPDTAHLVFYLRLSTWCRWEDTQSLPTAVLPVNCLFEIPTVAWPGWESQEFMRPHDSWGAPPRAYGCACHPQRWSFHPTTDSVPC